MPRDDGAPLRRTDQIADPKAVNNAVDALLYGGDEVRRSTRASGWNTLHYGEGDDAMKQWYEELTDIDATISENVGSNPTNLPTGSLLTKIDEAVDKLNSCFTLAVPVFQKRALHIHYDELAEVAGDLRAGKINSAEAQARFNVVIADVSEIVDFSNLFNG